MPRVTVKCVSETTGSAWGLGRAGRFQRPGLTANDIAIELDTIRREAHEECAAALKHLGATYDPKRRQAVYPDDICLGLLDSSHTFRGTDR